MRANKQWQYSLMGTNDTNWGRLAVAGIGLGNTFVQSSPLAEIPWRPLPSYQAAKLDADDRTNFNIAIQKGGVWPFAFVCHCPAEYDSDWPHDEQMAGKWHNINRTKSPFFNNSISVLVRLMKKKKFKISNSWVDKLGTDGFVAAHFQIFNMNGQYRAEVVVSDDIRSLNWGKVFDALTGKYSISEEDMQWYQFVPSTNIVPPLHDGILSHYARDRAMPLAQFFPSLSPVATFLQHPSPILPPLEPENANPEENDID
jgi:hypothetical protein